MARFFVASPLKLAFRLTLQGLWLAAILCTFFGGITSAANAAFHLWQISEVYSNADGSVQFIEMFDTNNGENFIGGFSLESDSDGVTKSYTFPANIPTGTATGGQHLLIATPGFGSLPGGVTPDYSLPAGPFFNPNATEITIDFDGSGASLSASSGTFPTDGVNSLNNTGIEVNSPTNIHGNSGSVDFSTPSTTGDYDGNGTVDAADYVIWRKSLNQSASPKGSGADGDADGTIGPGDYTFWRAHFGNEIVTDTGLGAAAAPEPAALVLTLAGFVATLLHRRR
jgi:serralysin